MISETREFDGCDVAGGKKRSAPQQSVNTKKQKENNEGTSYRHTNKVQVVSQNELANDQTIRMEIRQNQLTIGSGEKKSRTKDNTKHLMSGTQAENTDHQGDHVLPSNSTKKKSKKDYRALLPVSARALRSHNVT